LKKLASGSAVSNRSEAVTAAPAHPPSPEDLRARINEAKELWVARVEISRAQWIERLKLESASADAFDRAINGMNEQLYAAMQNLSTGVESADMLTPETGLRAFSEMSSVLVQTYDDIRAVVPEEGQADLAQLETTDFVDPAVADPLIAVQDKLGDRSDRFRDRTRHLR
jgi:hypothetical protein